MRKRFFRGCYRFCFSSSPPLRPPFWRPAPILPAPSSGHTVQSTFMFAATLAGSVGLRVSAPAPADGAGPTPRFGDPPPSSGRSGAENRSAEDPQASGAARRLRTVRRSAPETCLSSSSTLSRGRPPTPTRTLVDLGAAPYNRSRCCSHACRETTQKDSADGGVQIITPAGPKQSLLLAKDPDQCL